MALLPGWDRARLEMASPSDVAAARLLVYAQRVRPILEVDVDDRLTELAREERPATKSQLQLERARRREELHQLRKLQLGIRGVLGLEAEPG